MTYKQAKNLPQRIGMLRQWLNEERIDDPKKMVTNAEIEFWLGLIGKKEFKERRKEDERNRIDVIGIIEGIKKNPSI